jgi:hypothetical protein
LADVFKFEGGEQLRRELKRVEGAFIAAMGEALVAEAQAVKTMGAEAAPRITGGLAGTAKVSVSKRENRIEAAAGFTNPNAAAIHEGVHWGHKSRETRGFHWYRRVFESWQPQATERIIARLKRVANEGGGGGGAGAPPSKSPARPSALQRKLKKAKKLLGRRLRKAKKLGGKALKVGTRTGKKALKASTRTGKKALRAGKRLGRRARKVSRRLF